MQSRRSGDDPASGFAGMLARLREQGCAILVANDLDVQTSKATARVVLGSPEERRCRVLAFDETPPASKVAALLPSGVAVADETVTVVTNGRPARSAATVATSVDSGPDTNGTGGDDDAPDPTSGGGDLDRFAQRIGRALADADERFGPLRSAELRFAAFDLADLARTYDAWQVRQFCRIVGAQVRGLRGMAYFFVGSGMDEVVVETLEPVCDARIDVRKETPHGDYSQRWHVREFDYTTPWFGMGPPE